MTDFSKILDKAKELEAKMKESQELIKKIQVIGVSGGDAVKVTLTDSPPDIPTTLIFFIFSWLSFIFPSNSLAFSKILLKSVIIHFP